VNDPIHARASATRPRPRWLWGLAVLLAAGCGREEITEYRAPKDVPPPTMTAMDAARAEESPTPQIKYKAPAGWTELGAGGPSAARFSITAGTNQTAEVSVMPFPGEGAGELDLVNITRQKDKLPPLSPEELSRVTENVAVGDGQGKMIDFSAATAAAANAPGSRIIVTVFPRGGVTWFIKLAGDSDVVTAQKPALIEFLKSLSIVAGAPVVAAGHAGQTAAGVEPGKPAWDIPPGWREVPPTAMLLAKFVITDAGGEADVTVSVFPGDTGGLLANVNRWRGMVGLAPIEAGDLERNVSPLDAPGSRATLVDVSGRDSKTAKDARLVGIVWPRGGQTWFFKLTGDPAVAAGQKSAFVKFALSARFPNG
jgi:hypothetical protein